VRRGRGLILLLALLLLALAILALLALSGVFLLGRLLPLLLRAIPSRLALSLGFGECRLSSIRCRRGLLRGGLRLSLGSLRGGLAFGGSLPLRAVLSSA